MAAYGVKQNYSNSHFHSPTKGHPAQPARMLSPSPCLSSLPLSDGCADADVSLSLISPALCFPEVKAILPVFSGVSIIYIYIYMYIPVPGDRNHPWLRMTSQAQEANVRVN